MVSKCNICADHLFHLDQELSAVPCGHMFHRACLNEWWSRKHNCPTCRKVFQRKIDKLYFEDCDVAYNERLNLKIKELRENLKHIEEHKKVLEVVVTEQTNALQQRPTAEAMEELKEINSAMEKEIRNIMEENEKKQAKTDEWNQLQSRNIGQLHALLLEKNEKLKESESLNCENVNILKNFRECLQIISRREDEVYNLRREYDRLRASTFEKISLLLPKATNSHSQLQEFYDQTLEECDKLESLLRKARRENNELQKNLHGKEAKIKELQEHMITLPKKGIPFSIAAILTILAIFALCLSSMWGNCNILTP